MRGGAWRILMWPIVGLVAMGILFAHGAAAQSATGTVTGRVLWGPCIRAIPLPAAPTSPDAQAQPAPQPQPTTSGLPAGAVLVAVQSTGVSAGMRPFGFSEINSGDFWSLVPKEIRCGS